MEETSLAGLTLHVRDLERSLEFYKRLPGAKIVVYRPDEFAMLRIGHGRLGLLQAKLPTSFHVEFESFDLNGLYEDLRSAGIEPDAPPEEKQWGETDFRAVDPDGNILEFGVAREASRSGARH
jgi:catechol 2,3-dioxygenase-like lactoylglutathione lyase family enzyme